MAKLNDGWYMVTYRTIAPDIVRVKDDEINGESVNDWLEMGFVLEPVVVVTQREYDALLAHAGVPVRRTD